MPPLGDCDLEIRVLVIAVELLITSGGRPVDEAGTGMILPPAMNGAAPWYCSSVHLDGRSVYDDNAASENLFCTRNCIAVVTFSMR